MATTTRYHSLARLFLVERLRHDEWRRRGRVNPAPKALDEYRFKLEDDTAPDARFFAEQPPPGRAAGGPLQRAPTLPPKNWKGLVRDKSRF